MTVSSVSSVSQDIIDSDVPLKSHSQVKDTLSLLAFLKVCPGRQFSTVTLIYLIGTCKYTKQSIKLSA